MPQASIRTRTSPGPGSGTGSTSIPISRGPDEPLTDQGRAEARAAGRWVAARYAPAALYASPFARAHETARLIGEAVGLVPDVVEALREQFFGELHGQPYDAFAAAPEAGTTTRWERRPPGGETLLEVARRAGPALDAIARRHAGEPVVVVSHGGVMAALRGHAAGDLETEPAVARNASGFVLTHDGRGYARGEEIVPADAEPAA